MEKRDLYDENKQKTGEVIEKGQPFRMEDIILQLSFGCKILKESF